MLCVSNFVEMCFHFLHNSLGRTTIVLSLDHLYKSKSGSVSHHQKLQLFPPCQTLKKHISQIHVQNLKHSLTQHKVSNPAILNLPNSSHTSIASSCSDENILIRTKNRTSTDGQTGLGEEETSFNFPLDRCPSKPCSPASSTTKDNSRRSSWGASNFGTDLRWTLQVLYKRSLVPLINSTVNLVKGLLHSMETNK